MTSSNGLITDKPFPPRLQQFNYLIQLCVCVAVEKDTFKFDNLDKQSETQEETVTRCGSCFKPGSPIGQKSCLKVHDDCDECGYVNDEYDDVDQFEDDVDEQE